MFKILFKVALRNVVRRRLQSFLICFMVTLTSLAVFAMVAMQTGAYKLIEDSYTQIFYGDIQVRNADYVNKDEDFDKFVKQEDLVQILNTLQNYSKTKVNITERYVHFALADSNNKNYAFQLIGINPLQEQNVSIIASKIKSGSYLNEQDYNGILIGEELANYFGLKVGSELTLMTNDIYDSFVIDVFKVTGIYKTGDLEMDRASAFINLSYFQDNITYSYDTLSNITIKIDDYQKREELIKELQSVAPKNVSVVPWSDILPDIKQTIGFQFTVSMFFYIILIAIIAFALLNALVLSTIKRIPEFGVLDAIGLNKKYFKYILLSESFIVTTFSVLLSSLLGMIFVFYFANHGISLPSPADQGDRPLTLISNKIYPNPYSKLLLVGPSVMYVFSMLSCVPALLKLKKSNPVKSITS